MAISDYSAILQCLNACGARYLVVGGYAVMRYSEPRFTKDPNWWIDKPARGALECGGSTPPFERSARRDPPLGGQAMDSTCRPEGRLYGPWPTFRIHHVQKNVVDAGQVAMALGFEPFENLGVQPDAHRHLSPDVAQAHQISQLLVREGRHIAELDVRIIPGGLTFGGVTECPTLSFSQLPAPDIF